MSRRAIVPLLLCLILIASTGCSLFSSDGPDDAFRAFADALQRKDAGVAANATTDPSAANPVITSMFEGLGGNAAVTVAASEIENGDDEQNRGTLHYVWTFGEGRTLEYDAGVTAAKVGDDWRVQWSPTDLHPKLSNGLSFQYSDDKNFLTQVVDRDGQPLMTWQTIGVVNLSRDHQDSAAALAPLLQQFDPSVTPQNITDQFAGNADGQVTVIKLRDTDWRSCAINSPRFRG